MPRTTRATDLSGVEKGYILATKQATNLSNRNIAEKIGRDEKSVRKFLRQADECDKENIDPLHSNALNPTPRPGRPSMLDERDIRRLIRQATKNRKQRRKTWVTIAQECAIIASPRTLKLAFASHGYGRHKRHFKPLLTPENKKVRLAYCEDWIPLLKGKEHLIIYCDETIISIGEKRGQEWVTRTEDEEYHPDCLDRRFKTRSAALFWGVYRANRIGPCHISKTENATQRKKSETHLNLVNSFRNVENKMSAVSSQLDQLALPI